MRPAALSGLRVGRYLIASAARRGQCAGMVRYRRNRVPGGTFFFTLTLRDRKSDLLVRHVDALRASWWQAKARIPHEIIAVVLLPDHLHALIRLGEGVDDYSSLWCEIKKGFTRRVAHGRRTVWQSRFWEHTIRDETDLRAHIDYIHFNPVKHGHAARAADWPHSSFHRYVRAGDLTEDWAGNA